MTDEESLFAAIHENVALVPYDPSWASGFAEERERLHTLFPGLFLDLQHIGSTAVPGLLAKPIIDILAGVRTIDVVASHTEPLYASGYTTSAPFNAGLPDRKWFMRWKAGHRTHHLHIVEYGGRQWVERIQFRDLLRSDPGLASRYVALKERLAQAHATDREAYTEGKSAFIRLAIGMD